MNNGGCRGGVLRVILKELHSVFIITGYYCRVTPVSGSEAVGLRRLTNSSLENSSSSKKIDFSIVFN